MKLKKVIATALASAMVLSMAACGSEGASVSSDACSAGCHLHLQKAQHARKNQSCKYRHGVTSGPDK